MAEWSEYKHGGSYLILAGVIRVTVNWRDGGYKVSCMGRSLKKIFDCVTKAKIQGEVLARRIANEMLQDLKT